MGKQVQILVRILVVIRNTVAPLVLLPTYRVQHRVLSQGPSFPLMACLGTGSNPTVYIR